MIGAISIKGAKGNKGIPGQKGLKGERGDKGPKGNPGPKGYPAFENFPPALISYSSIAGTNELYNIESFVGNDFVSQLNGNTLLLERGDHIIFLDSLVGNMLAISNVRFRIIIEVNNIPILQDLDVNTINQGNIFSSFNFYSFRTSGQETLRFRITSTTNVRLLNENQVILLGGNDYSTCQIYSQEY